MKFHEVFLSRLKLFEVLPFAGREASKTSGGKAEVRARA